MEQKEEYGEIWETFPGEFREMCLLISSNSSDYCIPGAILYLMDRQKEVTASEHAVSRSQYALWVDHFFMTCMYPLENRQKAWTANLKGLGSLLASYEDLLGDLFRHDRAVNGHRSEDMIVHQCDLACLSQRLNVYFYTWCQFAGDVKRCRERLATILADSKSNVSYLLSHENAGDLFAREWIEDDDFYYPGIEYWQEPLSWLYHDARLWEQEYGLLSAYGAYVQHLTACAYRPENEAVRKKLIAVAIQRLTKLRDAADGMPKAVDRPLLRVLKGIGRRDAQAPWKDDASEEGVPWAWKFQLMALMLALYGVFCLKVVPVSHPRPLALIAGGVVTAGLAVLICNTIPLLKDLFAWFGFHDDSDEDDFDGGS